MRRQVACGLWLAATAVPPAVQAFDGDLRGQLTTTAQYHPAFSSPYEGANSLQHGGRGKETTDLTLFAGARLWSGAEAFVNPEIDQGFGLSDTLGVAGFPSGEAYKVGASAPYFRLQRAFLRQTFDLAGPRTAVERAPNQLGGDLAQNNVVVTLGKFSVVDLFDTNSYAHDPRADFLNWSIIDAGAFDYAADAWGYTLGGAVEWNQGAWTTRYGVFNLSKVPNGKALETAFGQFALMGEIERRYTLNERDGKLKLLGFVNRGRMGSYSDALQQAQLTGGTPDTARVRRFASHPGFTVNWEQKLGAQLGGFARLSCNNGGEEAYEFTEINRSLSAGVSLSGAGWQRPADSVGLAGVVNDLSRQARKYLAAGGLGILIGDGQLPHYGTEKIAELYYSARLVEHLSLDLDYQFVDDPAYNRDRGPVSIFGLRLHLET